MLFHVWMSVNSIRHGLLEQEPDKLQRIQNTAARLITGSKKHEHITPALRELLWLPVESRNDNVILITFKIVDGPSRGYPGVVNR